MRVLRWACHLFSDKMGPQRRSSDIISLLVSIYGSKDIFIDEYRAVLADRLLHQLNYNTARFAPPPSKNRRIEDRGGRVSRC